MTFYPEEYNDVPKVGDVFVVVEVDDNVIDFHWGPCTCVKLEQVLTHLTALADQRDKRDAHSLIALINGWLAADSEYDSDIIEFLNEIATPAYADSDVASLLETLKSRAAVLLQKYDREMETVTEPAHK